MNLLNRFLKIKNNPSEIYIKPNIKYFCLYNTFYIKNSFIDIRDNNSIYNWNRIIIMEF